MRRGAWAWRLSDRPLLAVLFPGVDGLGGQRRYPWGRRPARVLRDRNRDGPFNTDAGKVVQIQGHGSRYRPRQSMGAVSMADCLSDLPGETLHQSLPIGMAM